MPRSIAAPSPARAPRPDTVERLPAPGDERPAQRRRQAGSDLAPTGQAIPLQPRRPGPVLPMTPARATLWRQAPDPALLDNAPELLRMGIDPGVQRPRGPPPRGGTAAAAPGALWLPMALPVPSAPRPALPPDDPVAEQRKQVVDWLGHLRAVAAEVHAEGASPDDEPDAFRRLDKLAMPAIVAALNAGDPRLRLVYAHVDAPGGRADIPGDERFGSEGWTRFLSTAGSGRWRVVLDNMTHNLALDVHLEGSPFQPGRRGSVVHLSPSMPDGAEPLIIAAEMASQLRLPADWPLLVADIPAQKSMRSCRIFALSIASKCHQDASMDALHAQRLAGVPLPFTTLPVEAELLQPASYSSDSDGDRSESDDATAAGSGRSGHAVPSSPAPEGLLAQYLETAADAFGPAYMKHAQSRAAVLAYLARRPQDGGAPVNRKGQTLLERHDAHRVARWPQPSGGRQPGPLLQSASIELKRIAFLDKAIRHAARCDPHEIRTLCRSMEAVDSHWRDWYLS